MKFLSIYGKSSKPSHSITHLLDRIYKDPLSGASIVDRLVKMDEKQDAMFHCNFID